MKHKIIITLFFCFLLTPIVLLLTTKQTKIYIGNKLTQGKSFNKAKENVRLRKAVKVWQGIYKLYIPILYQLNISPNKDLIITGKNGWVFLGDIHNKEASQATRKINFTDIDAKNAVNKMLKLQDISNVYGAHFIFLVAPAKWHIYEDKLSQRKQKNKNDFLFDLIIKEKKNLNILDVRQELIDARKIAETYSKLDSHWTDFGAYIAWQKIAQEIKKVFPNFKPFGINALKDVKTIKIGSEYNKWFGFNKKNNFTIPILNQRYINYLKLQKNGAWKEVDGKIKNSAFDGAKTINESGKLKIMIISDSQGTHLSPYLTSSFNELNMFHYHNINIFNPQMFEVEIKNYNPDVILYIMTGRVLIDLT